MKVAPTPVPPGTRLQRDPLAVIGVPLGPIVLEGRYRLLVGALWRLGRSQRGQWVLAAGREPLWDRSGMTYGGGPRKRFTRFVNAERRQSGIGLAGCRAPAPWRSGRSSREGPLTRSADVFDDSDEFVERVAVLSRKADELLRAHYNCTLLGSARDGHAPPPPEVKQPFVA
jgi:hypothetical protein